MGSCGYGGGRWRSLWILQGWKQVPLTCRDRCGGDTLGSGEGSHAMYILWMPQGGHGALQTLGGLCEIWWGRYGWGYLIFIPGDTAHLGVVFKILGADSDLHPREHEKQQWPVHSTLQGVSADMERSRNEHGTPTLVCRLRESRPNGQAAAVGAGESGTLFAERRGWVRVQLYGSRCPQVGIYQGHTAIHTGATIWVFYIGIFSGGLVLLTVFNITPGGVAWWRSCYCG